jgi:hypothetical protein
MFKRVAGSVLCVLLWAGPASLVQAASRLVVLPVSVGGGADPDPALMSAVAEGLRQNPQWTVDQGEAIASLARFEATGLSEAELARLQTDLDAAAKKASAGSAGAEDAIERVRSDLRAAAKKGPRGERGDELLWRASTLLLAAVASKHPDRGVKVAQEMKLLFPGRKATDADKLPAAATKLLEAPTPDLGAKLKLLSRPEGCEAFLNSTSVGKAPVEVAVLQDEAYWGQVRCAPAAGQTAGAPLASHPKRITVPANESTRQEVLDAEFERAFAAEGLRRLRFSSAQERRQLEDSYARRLAERFDADAVVLASVGELSGADWLNARLYLRSGFLTRQGLVRLEAQRANALGRYLATGKDVPGVLNVEEAGALVAASRTLKPGGPASADAWYTDIAGWAFVGTGIATFALGQWGATNADKKQEEADAIRNDSERQGQLYREAQSTKFWSGVARVGGLLMVTTGVVLLLVPEYTGPSSEIFSLAPAPVPGGGALVLGGHF